MIEGRNKFARITCRACGAMCPEENWNRRAALAQKAEPDEQEVALQEIAEFGQDQLREPRTQEEKEQYAFEDWLASECPSGDVESVQRQWEESAEYLELQDATPAQPADAQPTGQSPCARHCEAPAFEGEIRRLKRELQTQAERIRVLWVALERADEVLEDMGCNQTSAACRAALEATK